MLLQLASQCNCCASLLCAPADVGTVCASVPGAPAIAALDVFAGSGSTYIIQVTLSPSADTGATGIAITSYTVLGTALSPNAANLTLSGNPASLKFNFTGLSCGKTYSFAATATNAAGLASTAGASSSSTTTACPIVSLLDNTNGLTSLLPLLNILSDAIDNTDWAAAVFTTSSPGTITSVSLLQDAGRPTIIELYLADGSNNPTGSALASQSFASNGIPSRGYATFNLSPPFVFSASTKYALVFKGPTTADIDLYQNALAILPLSPSGAVTFNAYRQTSDSGASWGIYPLGLFKFAVRVRGTIG